jgi:hypothetical protein
MAPASGVLGRRPARGRDVAREHGEENAPPLTPPRVIMKAIKYLSLVGKIAGLVSVLNVVPFVDPTVGVIVFATASLLKDTVNRIGDLLDDGQPNSSFKG